MDRIHEAIRALEDHYREYGQGRGLEYTYGYMDALAVLRGVATATVQFIGHPSQYTGTASTANDSIRQSDVI